MLSNCLDVLKFLRLLKLFSLHCIIIQSNCQKISLNVSISQPFVAKYFYSCLAMLRCSLVCFLGSQMALFDDRSDNDLTLPTSKLLAKKRKERTMPKNEIHPTLQNENICTFLNFSKNRKLPNISKLCFPIFTPGMTQNFPKENYPPL